MENRRILEINQSDLNFMLDFGFGEIWTVPLSKASTKPSCKINNFLLVEGNLSPVIYDFLTLVVFFW